jgi:hypothetical protein
MDRTPIAPQQDKSCVTRGIENGLAAQGRDDAAARVENSGESIGQREQRRLDVRRLDVPSRPGALEGFPRSHPVGCRTGPAERSTDTSTGLEGESALARHVLTVRGLEARVEQGACPVRPTSERGEQGAFSQSMRQVVRITLR